MLWCVYNCITTFGANHGDKNHSWWIPPWMMGTVNGSNIACTKLIYILETMGSAKILRTLLMDSWAYSWAKTIKINQLSSGRTSADRNGGNPSKAPGATLDETNEWSFTTLSKAKKKWWINIWTIAYILASYFCWKKCCNPIFVTMLKI